MIKYVELHSINLSSCIEPHNNSNNSCVEPHYNKLANKLCRTSLKKIHLLNDEEPIFDFKYFVSHYLLLEFLEYCFDKNDKSQEKFL